MSRQERDPVFLVHCHHLHWMMVAGADKGTWSDAIVKLKIFSNKETACWAVHQNWAQLCQPANRPSVDAKMFVISYLPLHHGNRATCYLLYRRLGWLWTVGLLPQLLDFSLNDASYLSPSDDIGTSWGGIPFSRVLFLFSQKGFHNKWHTRSPILTGDSSVLIQFYLV